MPWADADPSRREAIRQAVADHYGLSIETLTLSKLLSSRSWFKRVMVSMLIGINVKLEREAERAQDQAAVLEAKIQVNTPR